ncbi:MAG: hypothetical protein RRY36_08160 [Bacteroidaceae bacterium]
MEEMYNELTTAKGLLLEINIEELKAETYDLNVLRNGVPQLSEELRETKKRISTLNNDNKVFLSRISELKTQKEHIEKSIQGYETAIASLNDNVLECKNELSNALKELVVSRKEIEMLKVGRNKKTKGSMYSEDKGV